MRPNDPNLTGWDQLAEPDRAELIMQRLKAMST